jgi:hypothetical protein
MCWSEWRAHSLGARSTAKTCIFENLLLIDLSTRSNKWQIDAKGIEYLVNRVTCKLLKASRIICVAARSYAMIFDNDTRGSDYRMHFVVGSNDGLSG